ncbi:MAG TPA: hypothetical protein PLR32_00805 [candidate division Zixibacteria bacterium]|nr:hypothetical protein [candidate division Zixibacteria bacterium]MDD4917460.1 hypothetical protein [candidate division Zixibacteria bacterium]MDM7972325.1 hypothetical protein [candidate division Zixibacteria bacterium]HOD66851.1 hypothetical protein [candidate division Zixibacteria bacterium]HOZ06811.1 hypothetical protein [candidate division Zixibacteria bacterium]
MSFSRPRLRALIALGVLAAAAIASCEQQQAASQTTGAADPGEARLEREYMRALAEMELARGDRTYLVIDPGRRALLLKLKGAVVFSVPITVVDDDTALSAGEVTDRLREFGLDLLGDDVEVSFLRDRYMFSRAGVIPDSILQIICDAVNADPALVQRFLPERFVLEWEGGAVLDVRTTVKGQATSAFGNIMAGLKQIIKRPFTTQLRVQMDAEAALTLYSVCEPGTPTILTAMQ